MKKLLQYLLLGLFFIAGFNTVKASHYSSGELYYKFVGYNPVDSTEMYEVTVIFYRDNNGATIGTGPLDLCVGSSCFGSQTYSIQKVMPDASQADPNDNNGGWYTDSATFPCAPPPTPGSSYSSHIYRDTINLPGRCADWLFEAAPACCRNATLNMASAPNLYISATLNNSFGYNNSPQFTSSPVKAFCLNQTFPWAQVASEADGDSLRYIMSQPQEGNCGSPVVIPYNTGYDASNPFPTVNGFNLDASTGTFTFTPAATAQTGLYQIKVEVYDYRFNTNSLQWEQVGSTVRDLQIPLSANCKDSIKDGPKIDVTSISVNADTLSQATVTTIRDSLRDKFNVPNIKIDSLLNSFTYVVPIVDYNCFDTTVIVNFETDAPVLCSSVDPRDFRIIGEDQISRPVVDVYYDCKELVTSQLRLKLHRPLDVNGDYLFYITTGNDGNTLLNACGFQLGGNFANILRVENCPDPYYQIRNVSVLDDQHVSVEWVADTTSYFNEPAVRQLFNKWEISRANNSYTFYTEAELEGASSYETRTFIDSMEDGFFVDNSVLRYNVNLVVNHNGRVSKDSAGLNFPNEISTILLKDSLVPNSDGDRIYLSWNEYYGWEDPFYHIQRAEFDTNQLPSAQVWEDLATQNETDADRSYIINIPIDENNYYGLRILAEDNMNGGPFESTSNVVYYGTVLDSSIFDTLSIPIVPNVFTPNGDMINDRFYVSSGAGDFSKVSVQIYDRWGKLVFDDPSFESKNNDIDGWDGTTNSGKKVNEGVYYYVISVTDAITNETTNFKGNVTVFL